MKRAWVIAWMEFRQFITSKVFLLMVFIMPIVMSGVYLLLFLAPKDKEFEERRIVVVDTTGLFYEHLLDAALDYNRHKVFDYPETGIPLQIRSTVDLEPYTGSAADLEALEIELSEQVGEGAFFAFVIIGKSLLEGLESNLPTATDEFTDISFEGRLRYYSGDPTENDLPSWIERTVNEKLKELRALSAGIAVDELEDITRWASMQRLGLAEKDKEGGEIRPAISELIRVYAVSFGSLMLLFLCANVTAPMMLNTVLEEKSNKIAEWLTAAVRPFHIMLGKLLGVTGVGLALAVLYVAVIVGVLTMAGQADAVQPAVYIWLFVFLLMTLLTYGSIWAAIGAACTQPKDAQSLGTVASIFLVVPMIIAPTILQGPDTYFAHVTSLIPPMTSFLMLMRISIPPGVETWELVLGFILNGAFTVACVWASSRIFRVGLLWQGQPPSLGRLVSWIWEKG